MSTIVMTEPTPSIRTRFDARMRRLLSATVVVAALFVPASSAAAFVVPRAAHAVEGFLQPHSLVDDRLPRR